VITRTEPRARARARACARPSRARTRRTIRAITAIHRHARMARSPASAWSGPPRKAHAPAARRGRSPPSWRCSLGSIPGGDRARPSARPWRPGLHRRRPATGRRPQTAEPCVVPRAVTFPFGGTLQARGTCSGIGPSLNRCSSARPFPLRGAQRAAPANAHAPAAAAGPVEGASAARQPATRATRGERPSLARRNRWERERGRDRFSPGRATTRLRRAPAPVMTRGERTTSPSEDQLPQPDPRRAALPAAQIG